MSGDEMNRRFSAGLEKDVVSRCEAAVSELRKVEYGKMVAFIMSTFASCCVYIVYAVNEMSSACAVAVSSLKSM